MPLSCWFLLSSTLFSKVDDLILVAETESDSVRQKVTTHIIGSVLVQCCCNTQMKENYFPVAIRVFRFLDKKIKNLRTYEPEEVRCKQCGEGIFFVLKTILRRFFKLFLLKARFRNFEKDWKISPSFLLRAKTHLAIVPLRITLMFYVCFHWNFLDLFC